MSLEALPERVQRLASERFGGSAVSWIHAAAMAFANQLEDNGAPTHRELVAPIAAWLQLDENENTAIGEALDLFQIAFDFADNVADAEEDGRSGRGYQRWYTEIPTAAGPCLPALLCSFALERLACTFAARSAYAIRRTVQVLGEMATGQGTAELTEQTELISGRQALLLCLPLWVRPDHDALDPRTRDEIELWAVLWGNTWQRAQHHQEAPSASTHFELREAVRKALECWPSVGPFQAGGPLSRASCFPSGLC